MSAPQRNYIGLTGGIGAGKSTAAARFVALGAAVLDADGISRRALEPDGCCYAEALELFGRGVLLPDRRIDRARVAALVFSDAALRARLNALVHPAVRREMLAQAARMGTGRLIVLDVPLLFESGYLAAPYPKLFRLDVIRRNKLRFDPRLKINEDVLFNLQYLRFLLFLQKNSAIYCLAGVYYNQNDMLAGSLSRSLRGDLLDAEAVTRPVLEAFLTDAKLPAPEIDRLVQISRVRAALNQYGLLTGCPGRMPFAQRRQLFARILQDADARAALRARLTADPNRLLALPYRLGVFLHSAWLLAAYTQLKNRFL